MSDYYNSLPDVVQVRVDKFNKLVQEGRYPYQARRFDVSAYAKGITENFGEYEGKKAAMAGRIMAKRGQGKASFYDLQDSTARIQLYIKVDDLGEEEYQRVLALDIGDIIGVEGTAFKTNRGQISVRVEKISLLAKSIQTMPEKFHGLKDADLRYRQRYVDLIVNPEVKETFVLRAKAIRSMREFMDARGFLEVQTPVLGTLAGGAAAKPFITHHNALGIPMYMRIALELPLKRLVVGGLEKVYEIGTVFRNEGMDASHNPEFTMMESYEAYADFNAVMDMVEELFHFVAKALHGTADIAYKGHEISLNPPFRKARMTDLVAEATGVDFDKITDLEEARQAGEKLGMRMEGSWGIGKIIEEAFDTFVESQLIQPTYVTHHPTEISPLSKKSEGDPRYTDRFELFIAGSEFANGFSELNDPFDQRERFEEQMRKKSMGEDATHPYDRDFVNALEFGLPPTGGVGIGVDRLVMLLSGEVTIRDVILFPTMKPIG
ncbi:MAG: lysine--tRNA ligase [Eubacteriaceae bacterium]|jgi:lysyl-tRNA synthetase class 2|nr:lysine--tRNA ligase [Eubacteriaceae bacterium]